MKKYLSLIAFMFMAVGLSAQETETLPEEGEVIVEKREEFTIPNRSQRENKSKLDISFNPMLTSRFKRSAAARQGWRKGHWAGVSIYYNGLIDNLGALSTPSEAPYMSLGAKSIGVALNPFSVTLIHGKRVGLLTGAGFEFNNFRFDQNVIGEIALRKSFFKKKLNVGLRVRDLFHTQQWNSTVVGEGFTNYNKSRTKNSTALYVTLTYKFNEGVENRSQRPPHPPM